MPDDDLKDLAKDTTEDPDLAHDISLRSGVPLLIDIEEFSKSNVEFRPEESEQQRVKRLKDANISSPDRNVNPSHLLENLGSETVTGLFWHHKRDQLVLVTITGRRLGISKSLLYVPEMVTSTHGFKAIPKDPVDTIVAVLRGRRPN